MAGDVEGVGLCNSRLLAFTSIGSRGRARYRHRLGFPPLCPNVTGMVFLGAGRRREVVYVSRAGGWRMRRGMSPGAPNFGLHGAPRRRRAGTLGKRTLGSLEKLRRDPVEPARSGSEVAWERSEPQAPSLELLPGARAASRQARPLLSAAPLLCASSARDEGPRWPLACPACTGRPAPGPSSCLWEGFPRTRALYSLPPGSALAAWSPRLFS